MKKRTVSTIAVAALAAAIAGYLLVTPESEPPVVAPQATPAVAPPPAEPVVIPEAVVAPVIAHPLAAAPADDREIHGMVEAGIGTGGYRSYGAAVSVPVGENGRLDLAYREGRNEPWGYGYGGYGLRGPGFYSPYGGGWRGRGYGADTTTKSMSMGFSWSKDGDADDRDPYHRGLYGYD